MNAIFLGKVWHWGLLIIAAVLFWYCGSQRLHVIQFNWFVIACLIGTGLAIAAIIFGHRPGEQVTRDPLLDTTEDALDGFDLNRD